MAEVADALAFTVYDQDSGTYVDMNTGLPVSPPSKPDIEEHEPSPHDRDSGVFLDDTEDALPRASTTPASRPTSTASLLTTCTPPESFPASISSPLTPPHTPSPSLSHTDSNATARRLRRPAELNLSNSGPSSAKPKSELEQRYALIRNSQTKSKAALKSPTQLLKDRLNLTPSKEKHERVHVFTPPQPMLNGCILPGPVAQMAAFLGSNVRARTEKDGRPAWWCKFDKLVVFDGVVEGVTGDPKEHGGLKFCTRSSKGLSIARRRGDAEAIIIPLDCRHCQDMLRRTEWKYDVQVCKRGVCWECRERCRWEVENPVDSVVGLENVESDEKVVGDDKQGSTKQKDRKEGNRERADSVLQGQEMQEEDLMEKVGIETDLRSPIEALSGIAERLDITVVEK